MAIGLFDGTSFFHFPGVFLTSLITPISFVTSRVFSLTEFQFFPLLGPITMSERLGELMRWLKESLHRDEEMSKTLRFLIPVSLIKHGERENLKFTVRIISGRAKSRHSPEQKLRRAHESPGRLYGIVHRGY